MVGSILAIVVGAGAGILLRDGVQNITPSATPGRPGPTATVGAVSVASPTSLPARPTSTPTEKPQPTAPSEKPAPTAAPVQPTTAPAPPTATVVATATPEQPARTPTAPSSGPSPTPIAESAAPAFVWISSAPQTLKKGQQVTVVAQTLPNARVTLTVLYGTMRETGISPVRADGSGLAEITWTVSTDAPTGPGRLVVSAQSHGDVVTQERGFLVE